MFSRFLKILKKAQCDKNAAKSFKSYYDKIDKSEAYKRYCKELQGLPCSMQNNLSITQSKNLFKLLNERSDLKILDLGAGSGGHQCRDCGPHRNPRARHMVQSGPAASTHLR